MKKRIQKHEDERKALLGNENSIELTEEKRRCPKCKSTNLLAVGEGADSSLYCLDCDYAEGVGVDK
ncbi:MAG: hypothetical protein HY223_04295 [Thaumarchaeota archaeon]|nr:hypothetical protein [Nitrososphaerota archaeon]